VAHVLLGSNKRTDAPEITLFVDSSLSFSFLFLQTEHINQIAAQHLLLLQIGHINQIASQQML
jgi:hypothetical protein